VQELLVKLAQDRFNLVVVGQFKRGKSSLMNAILARDLLPTGYLPLTSAITTLCYGPKDRALLKFKGWTLEKEIELSELREYITEEGNPGNNRGLLYAQIEVPSLFLRRGLYFIDTPGIGSSRHENTQTTYEFLPEADAIIFVTSVEGPLSEAEEQFLRDIQEYQRKLFVVVNKTDLVEQGELRQVIDYIQRTLEQVLGTADLRLFPLSAKLGMQAKLQRNDEALRSSGLEEFQSTLEFFLAEQKEVSFLVSILDRSWQLVQRINTMKSEMDGRISQIQETLQSLHSQLTDESRSETIPLRRVDQQLAEKRDGVMQKTFQKVQGKVDQLLAGYSCAICAVQSKAIFDFFASYQYELTHNVEVTEAFLARKGFCHFHTWQFSKIAAEKEISAGYAQLIELILADLRAALAQPPAIPVVFPGDVHCPACQFLADMETDQVQHLVNLLQAPEKQEQYTRSGGLCLPHMSLLLQEVTDASLSRKILETQMRRFEELSEDLRSFLLKRTAIQRGLLNTEEQSAWARAMVKMVGDRMVHHH
jgi:predicted GTPase